MKVGRVLAVVLAGGSLVLLAWVYVLAQQPRIVPGIQFPTTPTVNSDSYGPTPPVPAPPSRFATRAATESSSNAYQSFPPSVPPGADISLLAVRVELRKGLALDGQIAVTGPLVCGTAFGEAAIPLTAIRGIRLHDEPSATGTEPPAPPARIIPGGTERPVPQATIILTNNDSLTVSLRAAQIQVKTEWGEANIHVPHLKSLLMTSDDVQWQQANGRWTLVAVEKPAPAVADEASEVFRSTQSSDNTDATGLNAPPALTVPPPPNTPSTVPGLPAVPGLIEPPGPT